MLDCVGRWFRGEEHLPCCSRIRAVNLSRPGESVSSDLVLAKLNSKRDGDNQRWREIQSEGIRVSDRWPV